MADFTTSPVPDQFDHKIPVLNATDSCSNTVFNRLIQRLINNESYLNATLQNISRTKQSVYRGTNPTGGTPSQGALPPIVASFINCGKGLLSDPEFASGSSAVSVYSNAAYRPACARITDGTSGNGSGYILQFIHTANAAPALGGFASYFNSRANAQFVQIFRAKLPEGYKFIEAENSMGNAKNTCWYTSQEGTGRWEWYARFNYCGSSGTFSSGGHVYVSGPVPSESNPLVWYLAGVQVYDIVLT